MLCGVLIFLLGQGQWVLLQGVAWVEMLQDTERGVTLAERAASTFSGTAPCELCLVVQSGLQGETGEEETSQAPAPQDDLRLVYIHLTADTLDAPGVHILSFARGGLLPGSAVADPPLVPPPILG